MDQIKIGEFIARKRKERELTQMQFAELVGVSNKTVSKWETGARMPDVEIMQDVCDALRVTVNEFLAGEEFTEKEYRKRSEDNVIGLVQELHEIKETRRGGFLGILCSILLVISAMVLAMICSVEIVNIPYFLNVPAILYMAGLFLFILGAVGAFPKYIAGYQCWLKVKRYSTKEAEKIVCTLEYAKKLARSISLFVFFINVVAFCINYEHTEKIGPFLAGGILSLFYMIFIEIIHDQILYRCKMTMLDEGRSDS